MTGIYMSASSFVTIAVSGSGFFTTPGSYSFVVPDGVTAVSAVVVGGGGPSRNGNTQGGGGGALAYVNGVTVTPGETLVVIVGVPGTWPVGGSYTGGGTSSIARAAAPTVYFARASGGNQYANTGNSSTVAGAVQNGTGFAGGLAGRSANVRGAGGGGAGGYTGAGGKGGNGDGSPALMTAGEDSFGGGGGSSNSSIVETRPPGGGGGGVGLFGYTSIGAGGADLAGAGGGGGSPSGTTGTSGTSGSSANPGTGGFPGGGAGVRSSGQAQAAIDGGGGAVRIIWGPGRSFPSNAA